MASGADVAEVALDAAAVLAQLEDRAEVFVGGVDRRLDPRLLDRLDAARVGIVGRVVEQDRAGVLGAAGAKYARKANCVRTAKLSLT